MTPAGAGILNLGPASSAGREGTLGRTRGAAGQGDAEPRGGFDRALEAKSRSADGQRVDQKTAEASQAEEDARAQDAQGDAGTGANRFAIQGASADTVAETRSRLGRKLAELAEAARARIDRAMEVGVPPNRAASEATAAVARDLAALLARIDAETGGNAHEVVAEAFALAQAEAAGQDPGEAVTATGAEMLLGVAASALKVAPPVGRSLDVPPPRGMTQTGQAGRALALAAAALDRAAQPAAQAGGLAGPLTDVPSDRAASDAPQPDRTQPPRADDARGQPLFAPKPDRPAAPAGVPDPAGQGLRPAPGSDMALAGALRDAPEAGPLGEAARNGIFAADRAAAAAAAPAPRLAASVLAQMREARATADPTAGRTRIELSPRGLGALEVDLVTDPAGTTRIVIRAENPVVLDAMRGDRAALGDMLSDGGDRDGRFALDFEMFGDGRRGDDGDEETGDAGSVTVAEGPPAADETPVTATETPGADPSAALDILT